MKISTSTLTRVRIWDIDQASYTERFSNLNRYNDGDVARISCKHPRALISLHIDFLRGQ